MDPSVFRYGRCGVTRYYGAVCEGLARQGVQLTIPLVASNCDFRTALTRSTEWLRPFRLAGKVLHRLSRVWFHHLARAGEYDCILVTSPDFDADFLDHRPGAPFLMIVHDLMTCVAAPDGLYDAAGPGLLKLISLASRATRVVCISSDTRRALLEHGRVCPERVSVILTGNLLAASHPRPRPVDLPERFILFVGERSGRKSFYLLVSVLATVFAQDPTLHLVCTGEFRAPERELLAHHGISDRCHSMVADDATLVTLYQRALCLAYPSLYEGFGLPVIEAMHYGCPVITTRGGALEEVAAEAAIIIDPSAPDQLRDAIERISREPALRDRYATLGREHAKRFPVDAMMFALQKELLTIKESVQGF